MVYCEVAYGAPNTWYTGQTWPSTIIGSPFTTTYYYGVCTNAGGYGGFFRFNTNRTIDAYTGNNYDGTPPGLTATVTIIVDR